MARRPVALWASTTAGTHTIDGQQGFNQVAAEEAAAVRDQNLARGQLWWREAGRVNRSDSAFVCAAAHGSDALTQPASQPRISNNKALR